MVSLGTIKSWYTLMIRKRKHLQHHTFMYAKILFGILNAGATFKRAMDIAFADEKEKFIVIYLDDITVYSASDEEHLKHLRRALCMFLCYEGAHGACGKG